MEELDFILIGNVRIRRNTLINYKPYIKLHPSGDVYCIDYTYVINELSFTERESFKTDQLRDDNLIELDKVFLKK